MSLLVSHFKITCLLNKIEFYSDLYNTDFLKAALQTCNGDNSGGTDRPPLASTGNYELFYTEEFIQSICLWLYPGYRWNVKEYVKERLYGKGFT